MMQKDFMTICPKAWKEFSSDTLVKKQKQELKKLMGKSVDDLVNSTPESLFLHELTHAQAFFGTKGRLGKPNKSPSFVSRRCVD